MMRHLQIAAAIAVVALAGCATPASKSFPEITFKHLPPIRLDVAEIVYQPRYQPPVGPPNIGHEFPTPPATAAERWIADRLVAAGTQGRAVVSIVNAGAQEIRLPQTKGLTGAFTTDQEWRYDAQVEMTIEISDLNRQRTARAAAGAKQSRTVPEDASLADREKVWFELTETMMRRFDQTFEAQIRKDLGAFLN